MILVGFGAGVGWLWRSELWLSLNWCGTGCDGVCVDDGDDKGEGKI